MLFALRLSLHFPIIYLKRNDLGSNPCVLYLIFAIAKDEECEEQGEEHAAGLDADGDRPQELIIKLLRRAVFTRDPVQKKKIYIDQ